MRGDLKASDSMRLEPEADCGGFEFHVREDKRNGYYSDIAYHMRRAIDANRDFDDELERYECAVAFDLLAEVMGR